VAIACELDDEDGILGSESGQARQNQLCTKMLTSMPIIATPARALDKPSARSGSRPAAATAFVQAASTKKTSNHAERKGAEWILLKGRGRPRSCRLVFAGKLSFGHTRKPSERDQALVGQVFHSLQNVARARAGRDTPVMVLQGTFVAGDREGPRVSRISTTEPSEPVAVALRTFMFRTASASARNGASAWTFNCQVRPKRLKSLT